MEYNFWKFLKEIRRILIIILILIIVVLVSLFKKTNNPDNPVVGQLYFIDFNEDGNPFEVKNIDTVIVLSVKSNFVKYSLYENGTYDTVLFRSKSTGKFNNIFSKCK